MPIQMKYYNSFQYDESNGSKATCTQEFTVKAYKFSNPDAYGAMALCYFEPGTSVSYPEPVKALDGWGRMMPTGKVEKKTRTIGDMGEWVSIHVRYLKPESSNN